MSGPLTIVGKAATERILGRGPGRIRAFAAATVAGAATAVMTYRLLRGTALGGDD
jgi:hypothetical protein